MNLCGYQTSDMSHIDHEHCTDLVSDCLETGKVQFTRIGAGTCDDELRLTFDCNILHLIIRTDGIVDVKRGESTSIQQMRPDDIETLWRNEVTNNPNLIAAVKTHPDAPHRFMIDVLDSLQLAGAERISLQMLEVG